MAEMTHYPGAPGVRSRGVGDRSTAHGARSPRRRPIILFLLLVTPAVLACGGTSPARPDRAGGSQPQAQAPAASERVVRPIRLNETVRVRGLELTVLDAQLSQGLRNQPPPPGLVYVGYKLRVVAVAKQQQIFSTDFKVSADGVEEGSFAFVAGNQAWEPPLPFARLPEGEAVIGWLSFQVRRPTQYVSFTYNGDESDTSADIKLDIRCCP